MFFGGAYFIIKEGVFEKMGGGGGGKEYRCFSSPMGGAAVRPGLLQCCVKEEGGERRNKLRERGATRRGGQGNKKTEKGQKTGNIGSTKVKGTPQTPKFYTNVIFYPAIDKSRQYRGKVGWKGWKKAGGHFKVRKKNI